jgi:hypothetical protein
MFIKYLISLHSWNGGTLEYWKIGSWDTVLLGKW